MPRCTIDGRQIDVAQGTTVIQAAQQLGIAIPHFCWHPDLSVDGNCRMCVVDVEGAPKLQIACNTVVTDGMVVHTNTPRVIETRRSTLELLLINHPIDCPVCDQAGECYLQDQYMEHGLHQSQVSLEDKVRKRKVVDLGPIVLDAERCVMCSRCLRFEREVTQTNQLAFLGRGDHMQICSFEDRPISHNYAGNLADVCPVGALLSRDFRFKARVWFLTSTPSVCPGCSTGCNVYVDHYDSEVYRLRPRRNVEVNRSWMCDVGRALYKDIAPPTRLHGARRRGAEDHEALTLDAALDLLAARIRETTPDVAFVASPQATNEDLYAFRVLSETVSGMLEFRVGDPQDKIRVREDDVLLRADRNPNTQGCIDLDLGRSGLDEIVEACRAGRVKTLVLQGPELLRMPAAGIFLKNVPFVAAMAVHDEPVLDRVQLVLPAATWIESDGTYTNCDRRVQRLTRAFAPPGESRPRWQLAAGVLERLGRPLAAATPHAVFELLARSVPDYAGIDYRSLGGSGATLAVKEPPSK